MSTGSQIAIRRKQMKMTQQTLAEKLNVSFQAVSAWERDEYYPETEKLRSLAAALETTVSFLMEEEPAPARQWELHDAMFSVDNMLHRVKMYAQAMKLAETQKALRLMQKYHEGRFRKSNNGEKVPFVIHPLMMACHAFALGLDQDELIAAILIHDVVEDCGVAVDELDVCDEVRQAVEVLTRPEGDKWKQESSEKSADGAGKSGRSGKAKAGSSSALASESKDREEADRLYFQRISENEIAAVVKLLDRCNNVSTMATGFKPARMIEYIDETEKYILPLLEKVRHDYDNYYDAAFLLKYQILSVMETLKRTL